MQLNMSRDQSNAQKFKHHDAGFYSIELADSLTLGKKQFNANSITQRGSKQEERVGEMIQKHTRKSVRGSKPRYNAITGAPDTYISMKNSHARQTLLPPPKNFINNGHGKPEYSAGLATSPRVFYKQSGDMTHF